VKKKPFLLPLLKIEPPLKKKIFFQNASFLLASAPRILSVARAMIEAFEGVTFVSAAISACSPFFVSCPHFNWANNS